MLLAAMTTGECIVTCIAIICGTIVYIIINR